MEIKITIELSHEFEELLHRLIDAIEQVNDYEDDDEDESGAAM
jgi:hypothetical protein